MWILFALTSAIILASRKIQEKQLVGEGGQALGWMLRIGTVVGTGVLWIVFSRNIEGLFLTPVILSFVYSFIAYPLSVYMYLRAIHELPLSVFGMMSPFILVVSGICSFLFLGHHISLFGGIGIFLMSLSLMALFYKREKSVLPLSALLLGLGTYAVMGLGYTVDKIALTHTNSFIYSFVNQCVALISIALMNVVFFKGLRIDFYKKNFIQITSIGLLSGLSYYLAVTAVQLADNVAYPVAIMNTHAILTTLYGIFILKEEITKKKVFVFICMILALVAFAFA